MPDRSICEPRGRRCCSVPFRSAIQLIFPCVCWDAMGGFLEGGIFRGVSPASGFLSVTSSRILKSLPCSGQHRHIGSPSLLSLYDYTVAPPGCPAPCLPRQMPLRLPVRRFSAHSSGYGYHSSRSRSEYPWVIIHRPPWHVPTLLKHRLFCRHPWARRPRRARPASSRGAACHRPPSVFPCQWCAHPLGEALIPFAFHFWDLWTACLQLFHHHTPGGTHCAAEIYGPLGAHLQGLGFSNACMRLLSARRDTNTPHTPHVCTNASAFPSTGTNRTAREASDSSHRMQGSPGPKSGRCSSFACCRPLSSLGLLLLHIQAARATTTSDARVPLASQVSGEAGRSTPAPRQAPAKASGNTGCDL